MRICLCVSLPLGRGLIYIDGSGYILDGVISKVLESVTRIIGHLFVIVSKISGIRVVAVT